MKRFIFIFILLIFASCGVKKSITSSTVKKDSVTIQSKDSLVQKNTDSVIIKTRLVKPDSIAVKNDIDLNQLDFFKKFFNQNHPYTIYDSTGQTKVETYIDSNNHLKQNILTKPTSIPVTDTTKISHSDKKEVKSTDKKEIHSETKNTKEVDVKEPNFFQKVWTAIQSFIWFIVIGAIIFIIYKFNIIGFIKKLFIK